MTPQCNQEQIRKLYDRSADFYCQMMDALVGCAAHSNTLEGLRERIAGNAGLLVDTACGSGHMLLLYRKTCDPHRQLFGLDLSPRSIALASKRLGEEGTVAVGDMCDLAIIEKGSAAAVINYFALHHLDPERVEWALRDWFRVLCQGGQLLLATWEGEGQIDYGEDSNIIALKYSEEKLRSLVLAAGFSVDRCVVEPVQGTPLNGVYLEGSKK